MFTIPSISDFLSHIMLSYHYFVLLLEDLQLQLNHPGFLRLFLQFLQISDVCERLYLHSLISPQNNSIVCTNSLGPTFSKVTSESLADCHETGINFGSSFFEFFSLFETR